MRERRRNRFGKPLLYALHRKIYFTEDYQAWLEMSKTKIEWTDRVWNPIRGCSLVSAGCENCYAMKQAHRFSGPGKAYEGLTELGATGPRWTGKVRFVPELLEEPLHWKKPCRIFVNSMSDLFHEDVPDDFILKVFGVMLKAHDHTFQVLTKRPARMLRVLHGSYFTETENMPDVSIPNIWLGVSVEDQKTADERIPLLLKTGARVKWISAEPLLGPINLRAWLMPGIGFNMTDETLSWVVVGGESGPHARPFYIEHAEEIIEQCKNDFVPIFIKQLGSNPWWADRRVKQAFKDRKGGDPAEWPEDLRVREFPK